MLGALVGKILGFAREMQMARLLGANYVADSFRASITATLLPIATLQGDIVPSVLIPMHREWTADGSAPRRFTLLTIVFGLITLPILAIVWLLADQWVGLLVGGFGPPAHALTVRFVRVMALSMPSLVIANCFSNIELSLGRSRIAVVRASVQNVAVMAGIGIMALTGDVMLIGWAFTVSMTATALYGGIMLVREHEVTLRGATLREARFVCLTFFRRVRVLLIQPLTDQGNILLERLLVSGVGVGALASIDYARTLSETAVYLISQPIGWVVLGQMASTRADTMARAEVLLRPMLALVIPAALFAAIFASDIVTVVLRRGAFQAHAVALTAAALQGIAVGLWATTIGWVLIRILNAAGRNRMAAGVLLCASVGQASVNLLTIHQIGVMGVGFGESTRGIIMLAGAAIALHSFGLLLELLLLMLGPAIGLALAGIAVRHVVGEPIVRLALGGLVFAAGAALCLLALAPSLRPMIARRLRLTHVAST
jgi:putative peptidoglycan lipid II flippase